MKSYLFSLSQSKPLLRVLSGLCTEFAAAGFLFAAVSIQNPATLIQSLVHGTVMALFACIIESKLEL